MERALLISVSAALGTAFFVWFSRAVKHKKMQQFVFATKWLMYPNAICYWRTALAALGFVLYFVFHFEAAGIFIFTFAAILDGVDGIVARTCNLVSPWGEWLDPMCDKLTYLPPMIGFAYTGILSPTQVWILVAVELIGQFFARHILSWMKISGAANNFGKIKAIICFALVILCALLDSNPELLNMADEVLTGCIVLSAASMVFKFIPNRLYADMLSLLNFCCGAIALVLTYHHMFAWAICIIIMGQLFDLFDGRMAIKHGGTKYGPLLDDIADFVSFGMAPAYVVLQRGGGRLAWVFALIFLAAVAFRLIRFVTVDKKRTDLPTGIFNGLPSPAGALFVLGASLVSSLPVLWLFTGLSAGFMVSHIRFAHFGRVILKKMPKPVFFLISATIIVTLAFIFKTRNVNMFGYLLLTSATIYLATGRLWVKEIKD